MALADYIKFEGHEEGHVPEAFTKNFPGGTLAHGFTSYDQTEMLANVFYGKDTPHLENRALAAFVGKIVHHPTSFISMLAKSQQIKPDFNHSPFNKLDQTITQGIKDLYEVAYDNNDQKSLRISEKLTAIDNACKTDSNDPNLNDLNKRIKASISQFFCDDAGQLALNKEGEIQEKWVKLKFGDLGKFNSIVLNAVPEGEAREHCKNELLNKTDHSQLNEVKGTELTKLLSDHTVDETFKDQVLEILTDSLQEALLSKHLSYVKEGEGEISSNIEEVINQFDSLFSQKYNSDPKQYNTCFSDFSKNNPNLSGKDRVILQQRASFAFPHNIVVDDGCPVNLPPISVDAYCQKLTGT